ncbi:TolC family protein [Algoriphagus hitonicola]|uniref:Outer membrane protein TolC n=1 Tax=Algoriphagus hitonicola TaxID=435880 RepID=A0A1I2XJ64_9BACT|nr:TolC family protein [Algoriphagus hitonicola]SFH13455.1 Outer membrane protein TolC [Algoriphagus hitonicola]
MAFSRLRLSILIFSAWLLTSGSGLGQILQFESLDALLLYAQKQAPEEEIRALQLERGQTVEKMAQYSLFPKIRAFGTWDDYLQLPVQLIPSEAFGGEPGTFTEIQFGTQYQLNLGIEASLPLINIGLWNQIKSEKYQAEMVSREIASQQLAWKEQISRQYYLLLLHQESLEIAQKNSEAADSIFYSAKAQFDVGELEPLPYQRIKANAFSAKNQEEIQRKQSLKTKQNLLRLIGESPNEELILSERLRNQKLKDINPEYELDQLPDWQLAQQQTQLSAQRLQEAKTAYFPTLSASGRFYQQTLSNDFNLQEKNAFEVGLIGLNLEWNLFSGGKQRLRSRQAKLDWEIAQRQEQITQETLQEEKLGLQAEIIQNQAVLQNFEEVITLYEDNFHLAGVQWLEGLITVDELLQVQQELLEQQRQYLGTLAELCTAKALIAFRIQSSISTR